MALLEHKNMAYPNMDDTIVPMPNMKCEIHSVVHIWKNGILYIIFIWVDSNCHTLDIYIYIYIYIYYVYSWIFLSFSVVT